MTKLLTVKEAADFLRVKPERITNMICAGVFQQGKHYFRVKGAIGTRFDQDALVEWLKEGGEKAKPKGIPMARGYEV